MRAVKVRRISILLTSIGVLASCSLALAFTVFTGYKRYVPREVDSRIEFYERLAKTEPSASAWRELGHAYIDAEKYADASRAYQEAADIYFAKDDLNAAYANERRAHRYETVVKPFIHRRAKRLSVERYYSGARLEPVYGCYTGAFIDHENKIEGTYLDEYGNTRRDITAFNHHVGSKQAIYFMYLGYGRKFPMRFAKMLKKHGAAAQIAYEPTDLNKVQDDEYLRTFAREARDSGVPVFIRFASEFNGDWTVYHGDPELYKEKFKLVAKVMHEEAPNVAMVWCPFEIPLRHIEPYYPGEEAVDWVGVNVYSVPFLDNDPSRDAEWRNPADALRFIYEKYSAKHPIMIAEYAASHMSSLDMKLREEFARTKIGQLYSALPRLYPRVKAVCWLSMNAIKHAIPGRQKNNYSLLDSDAKRKRYEQMLYAPYFLTSVSLNTPAVAGEEILELRDEQPFKGKVGLSAWVKTYEEKPTVIWRVNGVEKRRTDQVGAYKWTLDTTELPNGTNTIELIAYDSRGRVVGFESRAVKVYNRRNTK